MVCFGVGCGLGFFGLFMVFGVVVLVLFVCMKGMVFCIVGGWGEGGGVGVVVVLRL